MINYEKLFLDISEGFSESGHFLLKHLGLKELHKVTSFRDNLIEKYSKSGLKTEKQSLEILHKSGLWTESDEKSISQKRLEIEGIKKALPRISIPKEKRAIENRINEIKVELERKLISRRKYLGVTVESSADNSAYELEICLTICDKTKQQLMTWDEFNSLDHEEVNQYHEVFRKHRTEFSNKNVRNIAVQPFLLNLMYLIPQDSPHLLFDRPLKDFTTFQTSVCNTARIVRSIRESGREIAESAWQDVDELFKYLESGETPNKKDQLDASKEIRKNGGKSISLINSNKKL